LRQPCDIAEEDTPFIETRLEADGDEISLFVRLSVGDYQRSIEIKLPPDTPEDEQERQLAIMLFRLLSEYTEIIPPWGILTGVRAIKLFRRLRESGGEDYARSYFGERLLVSQPKIDLSAITERNEREILKTSSPNSFSLYVSVPFCPSRCSYCSFVSQSVEKSFKLIEPYVELLCREIEETGRIAAELSLKLESVYIGGGTPTTLSASQLEAVMSAINNSFDMSDCREFTVEAGRPDTVTPDKLYAIKNCGGDRISINPQTLNDKILEKIGRRHTSADFLRAYEMAVNAGFDHINTDLIAGLPGESFESFKSTLDKIAELDPKSITVHTLSMKRSSQLTMEGMETLSRDIRAAENMHLYCGEFLPDCGYEPYYLYRQSKMVGNLENVGWSKKGSEGIYNVFIMDETHTVLGCGAGATTKLKQPNGSYIERIFNYKYSYEYLNGFDEILKRKGRFKSFYEEYGL
ncbi:MAG: coproporphyrinogen dehydrogenase HemZ, partial [Acutalibacteraceae bacterium]